MHTIQLLGRSARLTNVRHNDAIATRSLDRSLRLQVQAGVDVAASVNNAEDRLHAHLNYVQTSVSAQLETCVVIQSGSARKAAMALEVVHQQMSSLLLDSFRKAAAADFNWMQDGFKSLLIGSHRLASQEAELESAGRLQSLGPRRPFQPLSVQRSYQHVAYDGKNANSTISRRQGTRLPDDEVEISAQLPSGRFHLIVSRSSSAICSSVTYDYSGFRFLFIPKPNNDFNIHGLAAAFIGPTIMSPMCAPVLCTFGVLPRDSPIISAIELEDISTVRKILAERQISARDRDEFGESLLFVCINYLGNGGLLLTYVACHVQLQF